MGHTGHIRGRGKEREEKEQNPLYLARRRAVEACHSRMNRFRKLLARYEKKAGNRLGLAEFACAIIVWRNLIPVHPGLIPE
jgi:glutathione S-transferase